MEGDLEAVLFGPVLPGEPQVPLAEVAGRIAGLRQHLGQGNYRRVQVVPAGGVEEGLVRGRSPGVARHARGAGGLVSAGGGDAVPRGVLPTENRSPGRRAERVGVGVGEEHGLPGKPVHVGRLVVFRAIDSAIHPAHVINEKEDDVGFVGAGGGREGMDEGQTEQSRSQGDFHIELLRGSVYQLLTT